MKYVYLALNWAIGLLFLGLGLFIIPDSIYASISLIILAALLLPPARNYIHAKTGKELSPKARSVSALVLLLAFSMFIGQAKKEEKSASDAAEQILASKKNAEIRKKNIEYYSTNKDEILTKANLVLVNGNHQEAIALTNKYLSSKDPELKRINTQAKTNKIKLQLKSIPASELDKNKSLYQQLVQLNPDNKSYKSKVNKYTKLIEEKKKNELAAANRAKNIETQFSQWDGSHRNLERLIKKAMNDPDSYEHDKTVYLDKGNHLIIKTTYRGKNAFGGIVRNFVEAKVSLEGHIIKVLDQS